MSNKKIIMHRHNGTDYDVLYPKTTIEQVENLQNKLDTKANTSHTHTISNITDFPSIPSKTSDLTNDSGYITSDDIPESLPASDVSDWAKAETKPTYTAAEVGALPSTTVIPTVPTNVSAFTNDSGYATETYVDNKLITVYKFKGSVDTYAELPSNATLGEVYNVLATDMNYAKTADGWDPLGTEVDLSAYRTSAAQDLIDATFATKTYVDAHTSPDEVYIGAAAPTDSETIWVDTSEQGVMPQVDGTVTENSANLITSGGVYTAVQNASGKINTIKVNNTTQTITDKTVNITVPTKTSQLSNDSGYATTSYVDSQIPADEVYIGTTAPTAEIMWVDTSDAGTAALVDTNITQNSVNLITSGAVWNALHNSTTKTLVVNEDDFGYYLDSSGSAVIKVQMDTTGYYIV